MSQADIDVGQMQAQIGNHGNIMIREAYNDGSYYVIHRLSKDYGEKGTYGWMRSLAGGNLDAKWELGNWGDTMVVYVRARGEYVDI